MPHASSVIEENNFNGYLLDTTFRVLSYFTTSILMALQFNTGFAIGYSFGKTKKLFKYILLFEKIKEICSVSFDNAIIEYD